MSLFVEMMSYSFIQRALLAGVLAALPCSLLGVFLVLRRLSLIGDGLAHVTFGSFAVGLFLKISSFLSLILSLFIVMLSSVGILKISRSSRLGGDAAIGIVSAAGVAAGVILASRSGGFNVDLYSLLFGSILAVTANDLLISLLLCLSVVAVLIFRYHEFFSLAFSEELAAISGVRTGRVNTLLVILTSMTVVLTMKLTGVLLVSSLLILPASSALQVARSFKWTLIVSALIGIASVCAGIVLSYAADLPAGAAIVLVNLLIFLACNGARVFLCSR